MGEHLEGSVPQPCQRQIGELRFEISGRPDRSDLFLDLGMQFPDADDATVSLRPSPAFYPGPPRVRTAFVLAVPGSEERDAERPAAGDTGDNLDRILIHLHGHDPDAFPSTHRYDYRIANAFETVMFGDDSMPDLANVREPGNLARLAEQLDGMVTIVALSEPAAEAVIAAGFRPAYSHVAHPGMRGLNNYYPGLGLERKYRQWRVEERCRRYAAEVIASRGC